MYYYVKEGVEEQVERVFPMMLLGLAGPSNTIITILLKSIVLDCGGCPLSQPPNKQKHFDAII